MTADEIRMAGFGAKRGGYNEMAVDYALDAFVVAVETLPFRPALTGVAAGPVTAVTAPPGGVGAVTAAPPGGPLTATSGADAGGRPGMPGVPEPRRYLGGETFHAAPVPASEIAYGGTSMPAPGEPEQAEEEDAPTLPGMPAVRADGEGPLRPSRIGAAEGRPLHPQEIGQAAGAWDPLGRDERVPWTPALAGYGPPDPVGGVRAAESAIHAMESGEADPHEAARPVGSALAAAWLESQAAKVERVLFRRGRFGSGYNEGQVDIFLDRVVATLRGTTDLPLTGDQVRAARFATVLFRTGYAVTQVDAFLAEVAGVLDRRDVLLSEQGQRV
ncbi:DivIVA domain-containing protein [Sphaerisporangium album]|uniref:DivIVA domain-containing protein n=1 Tax=Sphaerisporangium album TaxID=509200 RepID=A0A367FK35_9ACTN|nr:DivIVA domain-containing protein [Sphaerisporangium album]